MKIIIEVKDLKELSKWCQAQLGVLLDTKKHVFFDTSGQLRKNKKWEQFDLDSLIGWYKEGKKASWIASQLARDTQSIHAMVFKLRSKGMKFPSRRTSRAITISDN